ncbi:nitroreductase family protein [Sutterella wadsworthensis]|uniref:nitroreductase family protein n=1 Tax=Sutterella wadsworthensis TaxID=40545 RepID=UPI00266B6A1D|nr:nitroreductase family protein [Sutterella wadsworthensis]
MQNNVFLRLAQERYTTKHYNGQQIPREEFDTLLEILRLTPTSVNAQALHYFTATSQEARERCSPRFPNSTATALPVRAMWWSLPYPRR